MQVFFVNPNNNACPSQSVRNTRSMLALFSAVTWQVALFAILIVVISSVG